MEISFETLVYYKYTEYIYEGRGAEVNEEYVVEDIMQNFKLVIPINENMI